VRGRTPTTQKSKSRLVSLAAVQSQTDLRANAPCGRRTNARELLADVCERSSGRRRQEVRYVPALRQEDTKRREVVLLTQRPDRPETLREPGEVRGVVGCRPDGTRDLQDLTERGDAEATVDDRVDGEGEGDQADFRVVTNLSPDRRRAPRVKNVKDPGSPPPRLAKQKPLASSMESYYEARAREYDATTYELARDDAVAAEDLAHLEQVVSSLPSAEVLDVACGTGWLTRFLKGEVVAIDASWSMLRLARQRVGHALFLHAAVPPLPFLNRSFDRVFTSHFYGHLDETVRGAFVNEAFRVADELVVVEQAWVPGLDYEGLEDRTLCDGETYVVYKRYFTAEALAEELAGEVLLDTSTFVAVRAGTTT
jgi:SAM-dependent methyltransferase